MLDAICKDPGSNPVSVLTIVDTLTLIPPPLLLRRTPNATSSNAHTQLWFSSAALSAPGPILLLMS